MSSPASTCPTHGGQRVLVCGASGAIGSAIARHFAAQGARLALHYHVNVDVVRLLSDELETQFGQRGHAVHGDLSDAKQARDVLAQAKLALGGVDVVVTCVGGARDKPLVMVDSQELRETVRCNLAPVVHVCDAYRALRAEEGGGAVVVVSSITGLVGQPMRAVYGAAKAAVIAYVKSFAREVAASGMRANCVAPQVIEGGLADMMKQRMREILQANTPLARTCSAEDVAGACSFLAGKDAGFVTGSALNVTGGLVTW